MIVELLLADFSRGAGGLFEGGLCGRCAPLEQVGVVVGPVFHHGGGEVPGHDVVLVLLVKRTHDQFELFRQVEGAQLGRVGQAVHHVGDAAVLQAFGDGLPAVLDQLGSVSGLDAFLDHLVEAEDGAGLQHAAEDGLLAHQVGLHFGDEGGFQNPGAVATGAGGVGLGQLQTFALGVVFHVYGNQCGYAEAALVFLAHFGARALRRYHDHGNVIADLHAFFHDVETVGVGQAAALLHQRHDFADHGAVLLVRGQVEDHVRGRDQLLVGADGEAVFGGVFPGLALLADGAFAQGIGNVQAAVEQVQALVQALGAAADDDQLLAAQFFHAIGEFGQVHEAAFSQLLQLFAQRQRIEVVLTHCLAPLGIRLVDRTLRLFIRCVKR